MVRAIKEYVHVQPGGVIEIRRPELPVGAPAEVIVMIDDGQTPPPSLASLFGMAKGSFQSGEEADGFLRKERDAWDR